MPRTFTAQGLAAINNIRFETDAQGNLTKLEVACEVNYGTFGRNETIDLLPLLTATQKTAAKSFYATVKSKLEAMILG